MTARYYVQGGELWMIAAPGAADGGDSPLYHCLWSPRAAERERNEQYWADVVAALRATGMCEPEDRVAE